MEGRGEKYFIAKVPRKKSDCRGGGVILKALPTRGKRNSEQMKLK